MSFVWWLIVGLVVGAVARLNLPVRQTISVPATILLGIAGSFVGGLWSWAIVGGNAGLHPADLIMSSVGAVLLLWVWRTMKGPSVVH